MLRPPERRSASGAAGAAARRPPRRAGGRPAGCADAAWTGRPAASRHRGGADAGGRGVGRRPRLRRRRPGGGGGRRRGRRGAAERLAARWRSARRPLRARAWLLARDRRRAPPRPSRPRWRSDRRAPWPSPARRPRRRRATRSGRCALRQRRRVGDVRPELRHVAVLGVGDLAGQHLVQHAAERVDVGAAVDVWPWICSGAT